MKCYDASRLPSMITLGYDGENNWRPNSFDCSSLLKNHPSGVISLWLLPNGETQAFPVALERDGNTVIWTPLSGEMTAQTGALQLVCTDGTDVGKSAVVMFRVDESILPGADHPAAVPSWATQTIARAEAAADRAEEAAESIDIEALEARIAQAVEEYLEEHPVEAPVQSVNGKTGAVVLGASDVGALPDDTPIPAAVTVDSALSDTSENPVQNKAIVAALPTFRYDPNDAICEINNHEIAATYDANGDEFGETYALKSQLNAKYSKPSGGIPASDLAAGVIPTVPQMATQTDMSDWTSGKTVDAAILKNDFRSAMQLVTEIGNNVDLLANSISDLQDEKADKADLPTKTSDLTNDSGFQTAAQVQTTVNTAIGNIPDELPTVTASDNGKFLRVVSGAWAAQAVPFQTPRVAMTASDTTPTLDPNKLYVFPEMASLAITLATPTDASVVNEYHFIFASGATATTLTLPATINQPDGFTVEANHVYEVSILENNMTAQGWAVTA